MKRIIRNYLYNLIYQFSTFLLPIFLIPYVIDKLGPENLGIEAYTLTIVGFFVIFANFGIGTYGTREIAKIRDDEYKLKTETYKIILIKAFFSTLSFLVFIFIIRESTYSYFFMFQIIYFWGSSFFDVNWYYAGLEKFKLIVLRNLFTKLMGAILIFMMVNEESDFEKYLIITGAVILIPNIYFFVKVIKGLGKPNADEIKRIEIFQTVKKIFPFFVLALAVQIYMSIDKVILEYFSYTYELGVYSQIMKVLFAVIGPLTAVGTILMPYFSNAKEKNKNIDLDVKLSQSFDLLMILSIGMFFGLLSISRNIVELVLGNEFLLYENTFKIACLLILSGGLYNFVIQQILYPMNREKVYLFAIVLVSILKIISLYFIVPQYSLTVVMGIYIISEFLILFVSMFFIRKEFSFKKIFMRFNLLKILFAGLIMFLFLNIIDVSLLGQIMIGITIYILSLGVQGEKTTSEILKLIFSQNKKI